MSDTPAPSTLYTALLAAQSAMGHVRKDANNPAFRSKYATLQSVLDTIEGPLHANGLLVVQRLAASTTEKVDDAPVLFLVTDLIHAPTGTKIESITPVTCKDPHDPQKVGGALTYYRRYSLLALFNLGTEDDDGNLASTLPKGGNAPQTNQDRSGATKAPAQAETPAVTPTRPYTPVEFDAAQQTAWLMVEDAEPYAAVVSFFRERKPRMTPEQYQTALEEMKLIHAAIAARDAETPNPAAFAG